MIELDMESLLPEDDLVVDQAQSSPNLNKMTAPKGQLISECPFEILDFQKISQ